MNTKKKETENKKYGDVVWITTVVVVVTLIIIALVMAISNINFADLMLKLHGG
jgi:hypothetical protein